VPTLGTAPRAAWMYWRPAGAFPKPDTARGYAAPGSAQTDVQVLRSSANAQAVEPRSAECPRVFPSGISTYANRCSPIRLLVKALGGLAPRAVTVSDDQDRLMPVWSGPTRLAPSDQTETPPAGPHDVRVTTICVGTAHLAPGLERRSSTKSCRGHTSDDRQHASQPEPG
jgi:hypothetical protein